MVGPEEKLKSKLKKELRADLVTVNMLEKLQAGKKVITSYVAGRPLEAVLHAQARVKGKGLKTKEASELAARLSMSKRMTKKKKSERLPGLWG